MKARLSIAGRVGATLLAFAGTVAAAQEASPPVPGGTRASNAFAASIPDVFVSSDSEGFLTRKYGVGLYPWYEHGDRHTGLQVQRNTYTQAGWRMEGEAVAVVHRAVNPRTALGYQIKAGVDRINARQLLTLDGSYSLGLSQATTAEFIVNRERVETQEGLRDGLHQASVGAGLWHQVSEQVNAGGMLQVMRFSDGNTRTQARLRAVYDLLPEHGISAQVRYRAYRASDTQVPRRYFNPGEFEEGMVVIGMRRRLAGWVLRGAVGAGRQQVNAEGGTPTQLAELSVTSPVAGSVFWRTRVGYNRSSGLQGPDYRYRYLMQELFASF